MMKAKTLFWSLALAGASLAGLAGGALAQKSHDQITFPKLHDIRIPDVKRVTLDNGMKLYLLEDHELPLVNASARIRVGSIFDPQGKTGLAGITGTVMRTGGTESMDGDALDELLESIAASVETNIGTTSGSATMSVLKEDVDTGLKVLADVLMNPAFPQEKLDLAKVTARSGISRRNDDITGIARREFAKIIYGPDSPYTRQEEYATIDAITRDDLVAFHDAYFAPNNVMLAVWGDFETDAMVKKIRKAFSEWKSKEIDFPPMPKVDYRYKETINQVTKDDATQSNIIMGHIGIKRDDPDYFALLVMNRVLGSGGFSSRMVREVRTRLGLAYTTGATVSADWERPGSFFAWSLTRSENTMQAIRAVRDVIRGMTEGLITEEELAQAKDSYLNSFVFNFDSRAEVINRMMTYDYYGFPQDFLLQTKKKVEAVTREDVLRVAKKHLHPDQMQLLVVGNPADFDAPLSELGPVNEIDISIPEPGEALPEASAEDLSRGTDLMNQAIEACGGAAAVAKVKNYATKANVSLTLGPQSMDATVAATVVFPDRSVQDIHLPFGEVTQVLDGSKGWAASPQGTQDMKGSQLDDMRKGIFRDWINLMQGVARGDYKVQYIGSKEVTTPGGESGGAQATELISISDGDDLSVKVHLHAASHMPVMMTYRGATPMGPATMEEYFSLWKPIEGVMVPFKTQTNADGKEFAVSRVTSYVINGDVDEDLFKKP